MERESVTPFAAASAWEAMEESDQSTITRKSAGWRFSRLRA